MTEDWTTLLTQLTPEVLSGLASRIIGRIPKIQFGKVLTDEELAKLSNATSLSLAESQLLVDSLTDIYRSAAYASKRPAQLTKELRESSAADVSDEHLDALVEVWTKEGPSIVRALKTQSAVLTGGVWVENVSWELDVALASSSSSASPTACKAVLNFDLRDSSVPNAAHEPMTSSSSSSAQNSSTAEDFDRLSLEFDHRQLYEMYLTLETIQERMDALGK